MQIYFDGNLMTMLCWCEWQTKTWWGEKKSAITCLTNLFMNIHVQLLSTLVFCSIAFCLDNSCSEGRPHRHPVSPFPMNMIWILPAKCQVPWISTVDMMMPQWQPTHGCSHNRGERKGWGGARLPFHFSSSPGFKYCSDNLFQGILGNKGSRFGGQGGSWAIITLPPLLSFTVIKMNRDLSYWAQVHMRHELVTWGG